MDDYENSFQDIHNLIKEKKSTEAVQKLDELLGDIARKGEPNLIVEVLEELVGKYPKIRFLRMRLAAIYRKMGQTELALRELEILSDLDED